MCIKWVKDMCLLWGPYEMRLNLWLIGKTILINLININNNNIKKKNYVVLFQSKPYSSQTHAHQLCIKSKNAPAKHCPHNHTPQRSTSMKVLQCQPEPLRATVVYRHLFRTWKVVTVASIEMRNDWPSMVEVGERRMASLESTFTMWWWSRLERLAMNDDFGVH